MWLVSHSRVALHDNLKEEEEDSSVLCALVKFPLKRCDGKLSRLFAMKLREGIRAGDLNWFNFRVRCGEVRLCE